VKKAFYILTIFFLNSNLTVGQIASSIPPYKETEQPINKINPETEDYDNFAPGLAIFALFAFIFILVCVGVGIVLTVAGLLILFGLIGTGILSASILVGLNKKSFTKGFKTFLVSTTTIGGLLFGITSFWILNKATHWWTFKTTLFAGSIIGLLTGLVLGLVTFFLIQKLTSYLKLKLKTN